MKKIKLVILFFIIFCSYSFNLTFSADSKNVDKSQENTDTIFSAFTQELFINIFFALIVIILTFIFAKYFTSKITKYLESTYSSSDSGKEELFGVFARTINISILTIGFVITLSILGIDMGIFIAGIGFGIGFTLKVFLSNFIAGVLMVTQGTYHNGDIVEIGGAKGRIERIYSLFTAIKKFNGVMFYVPNIKFLEESVLNYSTTDRRRVDITVGIDYDADIVKAKKIILQVVEKFPNILPAPRPSIILSELADSSVNLTLKFWLNSKNGKILSTKSNVTETINLAFKQAGIAVPFPQITLSNRSDFKILTEKESI